MEKTIIAVSGTANTGKSLSISEVGRLLIGKGATTNSDINKKEYLAYMQYRKIDIGIQTYGDHVFYVDEGLEKFLKKGREIIVIACKKYGDTTKCIEEFAKRENYRVIWTSPYQVWDKSIPVNTIKDYFANHLLLMIDEIIVGRL